MCLDIWVWIHDFGFLGLGFWFWISGFSTLGKDSWAWIDRFEFDLTLTTFSWFSCSCADLQFGVSLIYVATSLIFSDSRRRVFDFAADCLLDFNICFSLPLLQNVSLLSAVCWHPLTQHTQVLVLSYALRTLRKFSVFSLFLCWFSSIFLFLIYSHGFSMIVHWQCWLSFMVSNCIWWSCGQACARVHIHGTAEPGETLWKISSWAGACTAWIHSHGGMDGRRFLSPCTRAHANENPSG